MTGKKIILFKRLEKPIQDAIYKTVEYMGNRGFYGKTIAATLGITVSQVYTVCGKLGIQLRDYRKGNNKVAKQIIALARPNRSFKLKEKKTG